MKKIFLVIIACFMMISTTFAETAKTKLPVVTLVWSHYIGWEFFAYLKSSGILDKWGQKAGVKFEVKLVNDYADSITQFTTGAVDAVAVTNMDALINPAINGVDSTFVIVGDTSNGNDGVLYKSKSPNDPFSLKDIRKVLLVTPSVNPYLLWRALQMQGLTDKGIVLKNTSDADIGTAFETGNPGLVVVTWNPILMKAKSVKGAKLLFDSSQIPGEIIDGLIVKTSMPEEVKKALVGAWYECMKIMTEAGPARDKLIAHISQSAECSVGEANAQLKTTSLFLEPKQALDFVSDPKLKDTMRLVQEFTFTHGLNNGMPVDSIGIETPSGVVGNPENIKLRFVDKYLKMAIEGKL